MKSKKQNYIFGINPIMEALKSSARRCYKLIIEEGKTNPRLRTLLEKPKANGVRVETLSRTLFQKQFGSHAHQGIVGYFSEKTILSLEDLVQLAYRVSSRPTLVLLDRIQDPQNLGAIMRSAESLGIQGIILTKHHSAPLNPTVAKCSAGAMEKLPIASVPNLSRAVDFLKAKDFWIVAVEPQGETPLPVFKADMPLTLIFGNEEKGIRPLLRQSCDFSVSIPMAGSIQSLNASASCAVVFYEILKQKSRPKK